MRTPEYLERYNQMVKDEHETVVTCTSCKHYQLNFINRIIRAPQFAKCARTRKVETSFDPVTGKNQTKSDISYCSTERSEYRGHNNECGPKGIHWIPRNKKDLFVLMKKEVA